MLGDQKKKVHLQTLGCRLNQSEIETMARQFRSLGHAVVDDPSQADWIVVNTCAVTNEASRKSRYLVRDLHRANPDAQITVTGCYAQIAPDDITVLPGVMRLVGNDRKDNLVTDVSGQPVERFDHEPIIRDTHPANVSRTRAFIKVQDGCDNACTFCVTTIARGAGRSRPLADIIDEVQALHAAGYQEVVLTGVHLGSYGHDRGELDGLFVLVQTLLAETNVPRIRLSSLEPWDLSPAFFDLWRNPRVCRHLHLPLQSGCDATLRRMARRTSQTSFAALVQAIRERVPEMNITTDVIVGFPGETDFEFEASAAYIEQMEFAGMHVFRYSRRPGTSAARMRGHVDEAVKKARSARLQALAYEAERRFAEKFLNAELDVLWEHISGASENGFFNTGYTDNYIRVVCVHPRVLTNHITPARMITYTPRGMHVNPQLG